MTAVTPVEPPGSKLAHMPRINESSGKELMSVHPSKADIDEDEE